MLPPPGGVLMKILLAEDDAPSRQALESLLQGWGYEVVAVGDGAAAWQVLQQDAAPRMALLDWLMPALDGLEVCRKVRTTPDLAPPYLILLSGKNSRQDVLTGLQGGADDFVTKP